MSTRNPIMDTQKTSSFLHCGCIWLEDKETLSSLALPKIPSTSHGGRAVSAPVLWLTACLSCLQIQISSTVLIPCTFCHFFPPTQKKEKKTFMGHCGCKPNIPGMWTEYEQQLFYDLLLQIMSSSCSNHRQCSETQVGEQVVTRACSALSHPQSDSSQTFLHLSVSARRRLQKVCSSTRPRAIFAAPLN